MFANIKQILYGNLEQKADTPEPIVVPKTTSKELQDYKFVSLDEEIRVNNEYYNKGIIPRGYWNRHWKIKDEYSHLFSLDDVCYISDMDDEYVYYRTYCSFSYHPYTKKRKMTISDFQKTFELKEFKNRHIEYEFPEE